MIPCVKWTKTGYASSIPKDYILEDNQDDEQHVP